MAIWFSQLPDWTTWLLLASVAIYDVFAVLCPRGPLKVLIETAQERQEDIPALLYSSSLYQMNNDKLTTIITDDGDTHDDLVLNTTNDHLVG
eukprot:CAMPEP_0201560048 /NCGR_PEP_ID=MMETSP0173_2-20130828/77938_1 /ASSEMBLY_ACC=CAM_ASM_000268 /TAXON_ID=218659 /ORGANISM="Vexillifera sp., Strain DIVA3 564/2" /LENGTH=91 /DNA_ID=CAMNT_0047974465 /DNA_START=251 /DNA_END=523 /DNA_ORIENTATION=+